MTQAQLALQNQLTQTNIADLTTQLFFNDSPVLFIEAMGQDPSVANSEQISSTEQIEHQTSSERHPTPPETLIMINLKGNLHLRKSDTKQ